MILLWKIAIGMCIFLFLCLCFLCYQIIKWLPEDYVLMVCKNGKLNLLSKKPYISKKSKKTVINFDGQEYPIVKNCSHEMDGSFFWKRLWVFDEHQVRGRKLDYCKDTWLDTETYRAIVNDVRIQRLSKHEEEFIKIILIVVLITAVLSGIASVINLLINLGIIKA